MNVVQTLMNVRCFFSGKVQKFVLAHLYFLFAFRLKFLIKFSIISFVEKKANSTFEQQKCRGLYKRDRRLLISNCLLAMFSGISQAAQTGHFK